MVCISQYAYGADMTDELDLEDLVPFKAPQNTHNPNKPPGFPPSAVNADAFSLDDDEEGKTE